MSTPNPTHIIADTIDFTLRQWLPPSLAKQATEDVVSKLTDAGYSINREYEPSVEGLLYDEAVSLGYWLANQLGEDVDRQSDLGETLTDTVKRLLAAAAEGEKP